MFFNKPEIIHGLDIGNFSIKLVTVYLNKEKIELKRAIYVKNNAGVFEDGILEDKEEVKKKMNNLFSNKKLSRGGLSCSVGSTYIVIRNINIPYMENEAIHETLKWEFSDHLPFSINQAVIDYMIRSKTVDELEITAVFAPLGIINSYFETLQIYNLKTLNIQPVALLSVLKFKNIDSTNLIMDIGFYSTNIIVGNSKNIFFTRNLKIGADQLIGFNDFNSEVEQELNLAELNQEVKRAIRFYNKNNSSDVIDKIYLTGGGAYINKIKENLSINKSQDTKILNPFSEIDFKNDVIENCYNSSNFLTEYSIAFGLCLSEVYDNENKFANRKK